MQPNVSERCDGRDTDLRMFLRSGSHHVIDASGLICDCSRYHVSDGLDWMLPMIRAVVNSSTDGDRVIKCSRCEHPNRNPKAMSARMGETDFKKLLSKKTHYSANRSTQNLYTMLCLSEVAVPFAFTTPHTMSYNIQANNVV